MNASVLHTCVVGLKPASGRIWSQSVFCTLIIVNQMNHNYPKQIELSTWKILTQVQWVVTIVAWRWMESIPMTCFCATTYHQHPQFQEGLFSETTLSETISTRSPMDLTAISRCATTLATITRRTQRTKSTAPGGEKFNVRDRMKRNILVHLIVRRCLMFW